MVSVGDSLELAGRTLRFGAGVRRREGSGRGRRIRDTRLRRNEHPHPAGKDRASDRAGRGRHGYAGRGAIESVSPGARSGGAIPGAIDSGGHRRLSCLRHHGDAEGDRSRRAKGPGSGRLALCRRGRGASGQSPARRVREPLAADLQLHGRSAEHRRCRSAHAARREYI